MRHFSLSFGFFLRCHAIANIFCKISLKTEDIWNHTLKDTENFWGISKWFFLPSLFSKNKKIAILIFYCLMVNNQLKWGTFLEKIAMWVGDDERISNYELET